MDRGGIGTLKETISKLAPISLWFLAGGLFTAGLSALNRGLTVGFDLVHINALIASFGVGGVSASIIGYFVLRKRSILKSQIQSQEITAKKLKESEQRFHDIAEAASDWFWEMDETLRFTYGSDRFFEITGFAPKDVIGKKRTILKSKDEEDEEKWTRHWADLENRRPFRDFQYDFTGPRGDAFHISISGQPVFDSNGAFKGYRGAGQDITERKRVEEALQEREERYRSVITTAHDGFWFLDMEGHILDVNDAYVQRSGYSREELLSMHVSDLEAVEDDVDVAAHIQKIISTGSDLFTSKHRTKSGEIWPIEVTTSYVDKDGGRFYTFIRDITERKRAEETQMKLTQAIEIVPVGIALFDRDDRLVFCNDQYRVFMDTMADILKPGVSFEEMIRTIVKRKPVKDAQGREEDFIRERMEHHRNPTGSFDIRRDDTWLVANETLLSDGGVFTIITDITERKRAEGALQAAEAQNRMILDAVGEGIYGLDLDGKTTFANPAAARMIGWEPEELLGKPQHDILHHTKPDGSPYPREECPIYAAFKDGKVHQVDNEVFWRKDGTSFPVEYTSTPAWKEGKISGAVVVFRDITARKRAEEAMKESEKRHRVFAADVAHELRTPLSVLQLHLEDLEDSGTALALRRDVDSMSRLVEQILTLARLDTMEVSTDDGADLYAVCTNVAVQLAPLTLKEGRSIEVVGAEGPVKVRGIPAALEQAVRNLVENAIKYSARGTTITIDVDEDAHVRVIDHGMGIPKDKREEIFERFLRSDRREDGSGLGLSIVRRTVEAHGGSIEVGDTPDGGATFTISFANTVH